MVFAVHEDVLFWPLIREFVDNSGCLGMILAADEGV